MKKIQGIVIFACFLSAQAWAVEGDFIKGLKHTLWVNHSRECDEMNRLVEDSINNPNTQVSDDEGEYLADVHGELCLEPVNQ